MLRLVLLTSLSVLFCRPAFGQSNLAQPSPDQRNSAAPTAIETILHQFDFGTDGFNPQSHLLVDSNGNLYGTTTVGGSGNAGIAFELKPAANGGWTETVLHYFGGDHLSGPSGLIFDSAGNLYGTASSGGALGNGAVFKLTLTQGVYKISTLYSFKWGSDGARPFSKLAFDSSGNLYGTTQIGGGSGCGGSGCGTVFKLTSSNGVWTDQVLYEFQGGDLDGEAPTAGVVLDPAGNIYGVTPTGGQGAFCHNLPNGCGMAFKLAPVSGSWTESALYFFEEEIPNGALALDGAGNLYGTTEAVGGPQGSVFELSPSTSGPWNHTILHDFLSGTTDGAFPIGGVTFDASGNIYGATGQVKTNLGAVFELTPSGSSWTEHLFYRFKGGADGLNPQAGVTLDSAGNLYGTTFAGGGVQSCSFGCGTVYVLKPKSGGGRTESVVHSFSNFNRGVEPEASLLFDSAGHIFGTTPSGGNGGGVIFRLNNRDGVWNYEAAYTFKRYDLAHGVTDGQLPVVGLIMDAAGNLYGTTTAGGTCTVNPGNGCGTVFKLTPNASGGWDERILYNFCSLTNCADGEGPLGGVVLDSAGNLYGTTYGGGAHDGGTVFKLNPNGLETVLYSFPFKPVANVSNPTGSLLFDAAGNLDGTALSGGPANSQFPQGVGGVFQLVHSASGNGWTEHVLHLFTGGSDGANPPGNLVIDSSGNLYGTATRGGNFGFGDVFQLAPAGNGTYQLSTLYSFQGGSDGGEPTSGLARDAAGNLYGVADPGGNNLGVVFELSPAGGGAWSESILHTFSGGTDGWFPFGGVILDGAGNIYGTTELGGVPNGGVVFEVTP